MSCGSRPAVYVRDIDAPAGAAKAVIREVVNNATSMRLRARFRRSVLVIINTTH
jgi:hypothetical protein